VAQERANANTWARHHRMGAVLQHGLHVYTDPVKAHADAPTYRGATYGGDPRHGRNSPTYVSMSNAPRRFYE